MADATTTPAPTGPMFNIQRIYLKDLSVENPSAPQSFAQQTQGPNVEVGLQTNAARIQDNFYDVAVTLNLTAKIGEQTLFLIECKQAGIFQIEGIPENELPQVLGVHCPNIIFPYARETVSDAVNRLGYPPVYLAPINFEALYQQQLQAELERLEKAGNVPASQVKQ